MVESIIIIALTAAFVLLLLKKTGVINWLQLHGNDIIHELASCDFCLSFWICLLLSAIASVIRSNYEYLIFAILSTPITRLLI